MSITIKKTIIQEHGERVLVRVNTTGSLKEVEGSLTFHEFWNNKAEFEDSQKEENTSEDEEVTGESKCRAVFKLTDDEAIIFFKELCNAN